MMFSSTKAEQIARHELVLLSPTAIATVRAVEHKSESGSRFLAAGVVAAPAEATILEALPDDGA